MNRVTLALCLERIRIDLPVIAKIQIFEEAGRLFSSREALTQKDIAASLAAREAVGSTGLGQGVAIPHARMKGLRQAVGAFIRPYPAISFNAPDGKPVSEMLVLLVPEQASDDHLTMLAEAAQMFRDRQFRDHLRKQGDAGGVYRAFSEWRETPV